MLCAPGSPWNSRRRSCIERTRAASAAPLEQLFAQRGIAAVALARCVLRPWHLVSLGTLVRRQATGANGVADGGATSGKTSGTASSRGRRRKVLLSNKHASNGQIQLDTPTDAYLMGKIEPTLLALAESVRSFKEDADLEVCLGQCTIYMPGIPKERAHQLIRDCH